MTLLVDYSFARPSPKAIKAAGYAGVMRYISGGNNAKNLTAPEAKALLAAGLTIGLVWETVASRAGAGHAAGAYDAGQAENNANRLGYPAEAVIFFAVDFDAQPNAVSQYFEGVLSATRRPVGVYGSLTVVEAMHAQGVPYMWQACAWSRGAVSKIAHLYQRNKATVSHPIPGTDENTVMHSFPMWGTAPAKTPPPVPPAPPPSATPPPAPAPAPAQPDPFQEDTMDRLIIALYRRYIGRTPSDAEVDGWLINAAQHGWAGKDIADRIQGSTEAQAHTVKP